MNDIVKILMRRDGLTKEEAEKYYEETMDYVRDLIGNGESERAEQYFCDELGLEPDYLINELI